MRLAPGAAEPPETALPSSVLRAMLPPMDASEALPTAGLRLPEIAHMRGILLAQGRAKGTG